MACIVTTTSNTNTQPTCSPISSVADFMKRKRPFDDFGSSSSKRICRCSDQYAAEIVDRDHSNRNFIENNVGKIDSAAFSFARAVFNWNAGVDTAADQFNSLVEDGSTVDFKTCQQSQLIGNKISIPRATNTFPVDGDLISLAVKQTLTSSRSDVIVGKRGSIEKPYLFRKLLGRLQQEVKYLDRQQRIKLSKSDVNEVATFCSNASNASTVAVNELPTSVDSVITTADDNCSTNDSRRMYTFRQLCRICQKLLKEQEKQLHEYYEKSLTMRLSEQYDCFLRFTQEQLDSKFTHSEAPSYIS